MSTEQNQPKNTGKNIRESDELKTEGPMSEKDEVKAAERRTAKLLKKDPKPNKGNY